MLVRIKSTTNSETDEHEEQNLTVSEANLSQNQWDFHSALRDSIQSSSLSWNFRNSSIESIARSHESNAITETLKAEEKKKKAKKFKDSEPVKKKKKELPVYSRIRTKNQWNRIRNSVFLKILAQISDWNPGKHENFIFTHSKAITNPRTM